MLKVNMVNRCIEYFFINDVGFEPEFENIYIYTTEGFKELKNLNNKDRLPLEDIDIEVNKILHDKYSECCIRFKDNLPMPKTHDSESNINHNSMGFYTSFYIDVDEITLTFKYKQKEYKILFKGP